MSQRQQILEKLEQVKQEKRRLTFEEICPKWSAVMQELDRLLEMNPDISFNEKQELGNKHGLNFADCAKCFVGEAHGFSSGYTDRDSAENCEECDSLAFSPEIADYINGSSRGLFQVGINKLVDHWNDVHAQEYRK